MRHVRSQIILLAGVVGVVCNVGPAGADEPGEVELFNGHDFTGWTFYLNDENAKLADVWSVVDGTIVCLGKPPGYLRTLDDYENYELTLEWRWKPGTKGGNSGVLVHASTPGELGVWPKSIEAQLAAGNAGDIWVIGETIEIDNPQGRILGRRHLNLTDDSENPPGEWNRYKITCRGDDLSIEVNGHLVNRAHHLSATKGAICLQSEGAEVHFRNLRLRRLDP